MSNYAAQATGFSLTSEDVQNLREDFPIERIERQMNIRERQAYMAETGRSLAEVVEASTAQITKFLSDANYSSSNK